MFACMHMFLCVYVNLYVYACMLICQSVCVCVCVRACVRACMRACAHTCVRAYVCAYVCVLHVYTCNAASFCLKRVKLYFTDVDTCRSHPCMNGGSCSNNIDSYKCDCAGDFGGSNCEEAPGRSKLITFLHVIQRLAKT